MRRQELPYLRGHGSGEAVLPGVLIVGRIECQWPMQVFESEQHALDWVTRAESSYPRHLYRLDVDTGDITPLFVTEPIPATLRPAT